MEQRTRTRTTTVLGGNIYLNGVLQAGSQVLAQSEETIDSWKKQVRNTGDVLNGTLPPSNFDHTIITRSPVQAYRPRAFGYSNYHFDGNFVGHTTADPGFGSPLLLPARSNIVRYNQNQALAKQLLAMTNPVRPEFSIPVFIKELVDIGSLFHLAAKTFAGYLGSSYLNYRFGWVQFVSDLKALSEVTKTLESRMKELQSLQKHGGLRRKAQLLSDSNSSYSPNVLSNTTYSCWMYANVTRRHKIKIYGTVRWTCTKDFASEIEKIGVLNKAFRLVFDLEHLDPETVWNLIPFSWLADYFTDIGTWLGANQGMAEVIPNDICIMRDFESSITQAPIFNAGHNIQFSGKGRYVRRYKGRDVVYLNVNAFPAVRTELLSWSQWKVVAALFASFKK